MDDDKPQGIYRSSKSIRNLKIRVRLRQATPSLLFDEEGSPLSSLLPQNNHSGKWDEKVISWQEKVFSQDEFKTYSNLEEPVTFLDKKYHEEVIEMRKRGSFSSEENMSRIFTYNNSDIKNFKFQPEDLMDTAETFLSSQMKTLRLRYAESKRDRQKHQHTNPVTIRPSGHHLLSPSSNVTSMYIMADVSHQLGEEEPEEVVLCSIHVNGNGIIAVKPDFNSDGAPYAIQNLKRDTFEYYIEHASDPLSEDETKREQQLMSQLLTKHSDYLSSCIGQEFDVVAPDVFKVGVFGEIVSASNFELNDLFIHYFFELPQGWSSSESSHLYGVTHTSKTTSSDYDEVAYFSHPFEYELIFSEASLTEESSLHQPQLFLEVLSFDFWERFHVEGYTCLTIPQKPGFYRFNLSTWKPVARSLSSRLRHYFIGGDHQLEELSYCAVPSNSEGSSVSKYGFTTETSGSVQINLNVIHQSQRFINLEPYQQNPPIYSFSQNQVMKTSISAVLSAFHRARHRMLAARGEHSGFKQE